MEQKGRYEQQEEGKQSPIPLKCPRCDSFETKFRYFNNHNLKQPRHYCKTCNRLWTVGGNLRNLPVGGHSKNNKQTKASSSISGNPRPQPPLPSMEEQPHNSQYLTPMGAIIPQHFDTTTMQQYTNQPPIVSPSNSYYFNDEISCLDATQSLIKPQVTNQHVNVGNQFCSGRAEMTLSQEWIPQPMALEQTIPQNPHRHIDSYQTLNQAHNAPHYHLNNSLVQPNWPMNTLPQNGVSNFHKSTSNACIGDDFGGNTKNEEMDTTSVDVDQWLDFSGYGPT